MSERVLRILNGRMSGKRKPEDERIIIRPFNRGNFVMQISLLVLVALTVYGLLSFDYKNIEFIQAIQLTLDNIATMVLEPAFSHLTLGEAVYQVFARGLVRA